MSNYTKAELKEFDELTMLLSSQRQMDRISGRLRIKAFIEKHGKEKCDAMFAELAQRDKPNPPPHRHGI